MRLARLATLLISVELLLLASLSEAEPKPCSNTEHNSWAKGCAWAVRSIRIAEDPPPTDSWERFSPFFFEPTNDLPEDFVDACYDALSDPMRLPDSAKDLLTGLGWPEVGANCTREQNLSWLRSCQSDAEALVGKTRAELLKTFETEGGIFTRSQRHFIHRRCRILKIEVGFRIDEGDTSRSERESDPVESVRVYVGMYFAG